MKSSHLRFHHFGLAVRRPAEARIFIAALGYQIGEAILDPGQNVHLAMCQHATEPAVEIIWPAEGKGPLDTLIAHHSAGLVYHLCYETDDLAVALAHLESAGLNVFCVSPPMPAPLFGGRKVSFYKVVGVGLIEVLEPAA